MSEQTETRQEKKSREAKAARQRAAYDPVKKKKLNDAYTARKKAERLAAKKTDKHHRPVSELTAKEREARREKARGYYAASQAKKKGKANGHAKANGKNGHVEVWKPGKGSIGVPELLKAHGHGPRSASHSALVERALGLIEAGLVLVSEELRRK